MIYKFSLSFSLYILRHVICACVWVRRYNTRRGAVRGCTATFMHCNFVMLRVNYLLARFLLFDVFILRHFEEEKWLCLCCCVCIPRYVILFGLGGGNIVLKFRTTRGMRRLRHVFQSIDIDCVSIV